MLPPLLKLRGKDSVILQIVIYANCKFNRTIFPFALGDH